LQAHTQRGAAQQQAAATQEHAALAVEQTAMAAEEQAAVAIVVVSSAGAHNCALHNTARARQWVSGQGWLSVAAVAVREAAEAMVASEGGQVQVAEVTCCLQSMFREPEEEAATECWQTAEMAVEMQAAEEWCKAAVAAAAATAAKGQSGMEEQQPKKQQQRANKRRRRIRRRANGAPRSCVLESGRWINLPRARRVTDVRVTAVRAQKQQRCCRFHNGTSGCRRSQCKFAPAGHAPAVDGPDVLDPMVEAKLEGLGHQLQIKFDRQFKELQVSTQQQQGEQQQRQQQADTAAAEVAARSAASTKATATTVEAAVEAAAARLAAVEEQLQQQQQTESSLWDDFLDPLVGQVQQQQQAQQQQQQRQQQLQEHVRYLERQGQMAEEQLRQTADELRRKKLTEQIQSGCAQIQSEYLDNSISRLSSEMHRLKQNVALSPPFELAMRHVFEDVGRLKATFAWLWMNDGSVTWVVPPDNTLLAKFGV